MSLRFTIPTCIADRMQMTAMIAGLIVVPVPSFAQVKITFLDVGQGDAALIESPEGTFALIDGGPSSNLAARLRNFGVDHLELVVASHGHADHIGGLANILRSLPVGRFLDNGLTANTNIYWNLQRAVDQSRVPRLQPIQQLVELGSVELRVLPFPGGVDQNDNSVGVLLEYGEFRALFTGDAQAEELNFWLDHGVPAVSVLKAAHHGSRNGVTPRWVDVTRPEVVLISVGDPNGFGHPEPWALRYYEAVSKQILRTDAHGDVTIVGHRDGSFDVRTARSIIATEPRYVVAPELTNEPTQDLITLLIVANAPGNDNYNLNGEYVIIRNNTDSPIDIGGWSLCDEARHCFTFPDGNRLVDSVVVYTGDGPADAGHLYAGYRSAIWNNDGDVATLSDRHGRLVARAAY